MLRIRLNQLSLPNHYMLNRIGDCAQVRLFINIHFNPKKGNRIYRTSGLYKLHLMLWRDDNNTIGSSYSPAIYHLPPCFCAVSPARLLEDFGCAEFGC